MLAKYSSDTYHDDLAEVVKVWMEAANAVVQRESALVNLEESITLHAHPQISPQA